MVLLKKTTLSLVLVLTIKYKFIISILLIRVKEEKISILLRSFFLVFSIVKKALDTKNSLIKIWKIN